MAAEIPNKKLRPDSFEGYVNYGLRGARVKAGYTAKELAEEARISMNLVYSYERLRCSPGKVVAQRISGLLGKNADELFPERLYEIARDVKVERREEDSQDALDYLDPLDGSVEGGDFFMKGSSTLDQMREEIFNVLKKLNYREREVIKLRYGFVNDSRYTLKKVASIFGVTGERIRQIERDAIKKLQEPLVVERLEGLLER